MKTTSQRILLATGLICWMVVGTSSRIDLAEWLLTLAPLVLIPLAVVLLPEPRGIAERHIARGMQLLQFPAALAFAAAFLVESPLVAVALAGPWTAYTAIAFVGGLLRTLHRSDLPWSERLTGLGQALMIVGSASACLALKEMRPFGFPVGIILLTGVHFHFAAFLLPTIAAVVARGQRSRSGKTLATAFQAGLLTAIPLVAIGILCQPPLEWAGVLLLSVCCAGVAMLQLVEAVRAGRDRSSRSRFRRGSGRVFLGLSSLALIAAMVLATAYAWGEYRGVSTIGIDTMIRTHGLLNAIGFCGGGLSGWLLLRPSREAADHYLTAGRESHPINRTRDAAFPTAL